jgi:lipopolysaccharide/colanic/teichoic acid biosynthesis glycosyltransferase
MEEGSMRNGAVESQMMRRYLLALTPHGRLWLRLQAEAECLCWRWLLGSGAVAKRSLDILISAVALVALSLPFVIIALLIKIEDGGPVFFIQKRVGRFGREFAMFKIRSMCLDAEQRLKDLLAKNQHQQGVTFKLKNDPRITRVGRWLRKFSLDELPQFFNVLIGDMSLVGPRPPVPREVALYSQADRRRLAVKPGITCLWQVSGRAEIDFSGQVQLDVQYIESQRITTDMRILVKTVPAVISGRGAC